MYLEHGNQPIHSTKEVKSFYQLQNPDMAVYMQSISNLFHTLSSYAQNGALENARVNRMVVQLYCVCIYFHVSGLWQYVETV